MGNRFVETIRYGRRFELVGRMLTDGEDLIFFIDETGRFLVPVNAVLAMLSGLGEVPLSGPVPGVVRLSESRKGVYLEIRGVLYVTPAARVRAVLSGKQKKGPVSLVG